MSRRNLFIVLLLVGSVAVAVPNEITSRGYLDVKDSECWDCHYTDDVPLKQMIEVTGPQTTAAIGDEFAYEVRVSNSWLAEIQKLEGGLNIANAPSLGFSSTQPPSLGETLLGAIPPVDLLDTSNLGNFLNEQTDFVTGFVEAGTTDLKITITPENTDAVIGPQLSARMYPGRSEPPSSPSTEYRAEAPGPGQPAVMHLQSGSEISDAGFGTWTVEVYLTPVSTGGSPTNVVGEVAYSVTFDKYYNVTGENVQFLSKTVSLDAGQATAFGWILVANEVPGPSEYITVDMNTTTYYLHDAHESSTYPDYAYVNRNFRFDLSEGGEGLQFSGTPQTGVAQDLALGVTVTKISEVVGYVSAVLLIASIYTGGMFGKATRRHQNSFFGAAKRRVAFHNFLSYGIITMAVIHLVLFVGPWEKSFYWTNGLIWGGIGIIAMLLLGVTGAIQVSMIRKWNYATWRWTHFGLAIAAIVFTLVHMFLDGANLGPTLDFVEWRDPFDPRI